MISRKVNIPMYKNNFFKDTFVRIYNWSENYFLLMYYNTDIIIIFARNIVQNEYKEADSIS
jgi:hypothetical protein